MKNDLMESSATEEASIAKPHKEAELSFRAQNEGNSDAAIAKASEGGLADDQKSHRDKIRKMVRAAVIAALYVTLTLAVFYFAYGAIQFRVSEALTILPLFFPESIIGLTIGCFISNIFGNGSLDLLLGTGATLVASILTFIIGRLKIKEPLKIILAILPPIVINALVVPLTFLKISELEELYWFNVLTVGAGQALVLVFLGIPLYYALKRLKAKLGILK